MWIDLRAARNDLTVIRYPQRDGALIGGSILADRPSSVRDEFCGHHARVGAPEATGIWHLTVSLGPGQVLSRTGWKRTIREIGRGIGVPFHLVPYLIYRHLRAAQDHVHVLFSAWTYSGQQLIPALPRNTLALGNRVALRLGLPRPFDDLPDAPVQIAAPVRKSRAGNLISTAARLAGTAINDVMNEERPRSVDQLQAALNERDISSTIRKRKNCPDGIALTLRVPSPGMERLHARPISIAGGRIGAQFTLRGLERRIEMLRYLHELPALIMLRRLCPDNPDIVDQHSDTRNENHDITDNATGRRPDRGLVELDRATASDRGSPRSDFSRTGAGPGRRAGDDEQAVRATGRYSDAGDGHPVGPRKASGGPSRTGRKGRPGRKDDLRDPQATDDDSRSRLIDVIAVLSRISQDSGRVMQVRLFPAGGFTVEVDGAPAVGFDGHSVRPAAQEFEGIAKDLADNLSLEFEPLMPEEEPDPPDDDLDFGM